MNDYIWFAIIASTALYILVRLIIHLIEFTMYMKIKEALLMELYNILSNSDDIKNMDLDEILKVLYKKIDQVKGRKFVDCIELDYSGSESMILNITMDNGKNKPKFDFNVELGDIINIKEIE